MAFVLPLISSLTFSLGARVEEWVSNSPKLLELRYYAARSTVKSVADHE